MYIGNPIIHLLTKMADNWRLTTPDLLSHLATLAFLNGGEEGKQVYSSYILGRTGYEIYQRFKNLHVSEVDVLRANTIARISDYVKRHPNASERQLSAEVTKEIQMFAEKVAALKQTK